MFCKDSGPQDAAPHGACWYQELFAGCPSYPKQILSPRTGEPRQPESPVLTLLQLSRLQTSLASSARGRAGAAPQPEANKPSEDSPLLCPVCSFLFPCRGYSAYEIHNWIHILQIYPLISHMKVQWDIQVPLMILIVILISLTLLPSRLFPVISITKVLTLAISTEHTDFI